MPVKQENVKFKKGDTVEPTFARLLDLNYATSRINRRYKDGTYEVEMLSGMKLRLNKNQMLYLGNEKIFRFRRMFCKPYWEKKLCKK